MRMSVAAVAALLLSVALLQDSGRSRGAALAGQPSVNVAVVPGLVAPTYQGFYGIPKLPVTDPQLSGFNFTALPAVDVKTTRLQPPTNEVRRSFLGRGATPHLPLSSGSSLSTSSTIQGPEMNIE